MTTCISLVKISFRQLHGYLFILCAPIFQPVACEGQIETWLSSFVSSLKGSLQFQMATALGYEKPRPKRRTIRSAGSRKVSVPVRASSSLSKQNKGWWSGEFFLVRKIVFTFFSDNGQIKNDDNNNDVVNL